jgi:hypothetical protein
LKIWNFKIFVGDDFDMFNFGFGAPEKTAFNLIVMKILPLAKFIHQKNIKK